MRTVAILGSTGSIGTQALDVVRRNPDRFKVVALTAATSHELLVGQIREFLPLLVAIADEEAAAEIKAGLGTLRGMEILAGTEAAETVARESEADIVLNAMVGAVGLAPSLAALQSGKSLALANKESLIVGGELVMDLVKGEPDRLIPVDSEHAALAQCLRGERKEDLKRVVITASGGPFREWSREELSKASVKEALAHPTWTMGPKITVDSATLMNKGLEVIEAHYLFGLEYRDIDSNTWRPLVDRSGNTTPYTADYTTFDRVLTHAVRLKILGTTENIKIGVQQLNVFGENYTVAREKGLIK